MFSLFKKKSEKEKLLEKHKKLLKEAYELSHKDRTASDFKMAEAEELLLKAESME